MKGAAWEGAPVLHAALIGLATVVTALLGAPAWAQTTTGRTFVSGTGSDGNPCSRTQPCRGFARAISLTSAGGEVIVLDSAGYGAFTISGPISISATGVDAAISVTSGDGITINAGASDVVNLRGLTITGTSNAGNGITFNSGGTLNIQNCIARGFGGDGIHLSPTNAANINISDTVVSSNGSYGIAVVNPGGAVSAFVARVQAIGNKFDGILFESDNSNPAIRAIVANSSGFGNSSGFVGMGNVSMMLVNDVASSNSTGLGIFGKMAIANTKVYDNSFGFDVANFSTLDTFGNNDIAGNAHTSGSLTPIGQQ